MRVLVTALPADLFPEDPLAIPVFTDQRPPRREAGRIDFRLGGVISKWMNDGTVDPASKTPTLFTPGSGGYYRQLVIQGAGSFQGLSAPSIEKALSSMAEVLLRTREPVFGLAARDFLRAHTPPRDSSEVILRALAHGCDLAGVESGPTARLHWEAEQVELLVQELRRFRHHLKRCLEWEIDRAPEDEFWFPVP